MKTEEVVSFVLGKYGFTIWPSGNGCEAFMLELDKERYVMVTDPFNAKPEGMTKPIVVAMFEWVGNECFERWAVSYRMLSEFVADMGFDEPPWVRRPQCYTDQCRTKPASGSQFCQKCITKMN